MHGLLMFQLRCGTVDDGYETSKKLNDCRSQPLKQCYLREDIAINDLIDYQNERTRFMFNLGAGGGAHYFKEKCH